LTLWKALSGKTTRRNKKVKKIKARKKERKKQTKHLLLQQNAHFFLLKAPDITICTLCLIFVPTCFNPRVSSSGGSMPVPG
jgi:hypothetical protein